MAIYRTGNSYSQFGGEVNITAQIEALINPKRGKGRLSEAPTRAAIPASKLEVVPQSAARSGGISSPLTEQTYDGATFYELTSSDGLFVLEYGAYTDYIDGDDNAVRVIHIDPTA